MRALEDLKDHLVNPPVPDVVYISQFSHSVTSNSL